MAQNDIIVPREGANNVLTEIVLADATTSARGLLSASDKTKLDGIAAGAEVNVNADWNASSGDAQILNKPTLGTAAAAATTDFAAASHTHAAADVTSGVFDNARINFAAPPAIGNTTPAAGSFSTLNATGTTELVNGGTTAGPFRLYNISSAANANYERGFMRWSSNVLQIGTEAGGTGSARALEFQTDGTTRLALSTGGLVQFAGTTSSFPALKRSSTTLQVRLADDSAFAPFEARDLSLTTAGAAAAETGFTLTHGRGNANDSVRLLFQPRGTANAAAANAEILCTGVSGPLARLTFRVNGSTRIQLGEGAPNVSTPSSTFADSFALALGSTMSADVILAREAANALSLVNATNAQTFRIYNTFTSTTSFERLNIRWASNECIIDAEAGSGGGTLRGIKLGSATSSLLGFYGATPVTQRAAIADATDAATTQARLNDLLAAMRSLGLIAT